MFEDWGRSFINNCLASGQTWRNRSFVIYSPLPLSVLYSPLYPSFIPPFPLSVLYFPLYPSFITPSLYLSYTPPLPYPSYTPPSFLYPSDTPPPFIRPTIPLYLSVIYLRIYLSVLYSLLLPLSVLRSPSIYPSYTSYIILHPPYTPPPFIRPILAPPSLYPSYAPPLFIRPILPLPFIRPNLPPSIYPPYTPPPFIRPSPSIYIRPTPSLYTSNTPFLFICPTPPLPLTHPISPNPFYMFYTPNHLSLYAPPPLTANRSRNLWKLFINFEEMSLALTCLPFSTSFSLWNSIVVYNSVLSFFFVKCSCEPV